MVYKVDKSAEFLGFSVYDLINNGLVDYLKSTVFTFLMASFCKTSTGFEIYFSIPIHTLYGAMSAHHKINSEQ